MSNAADDGSRGSLRLGRALDEARGQIAAGQASAAAALGGEWNYSGGGGGNGGVLGAPNGVAGVERDSGAGGGGGVGWICIKTTSGAIAGTPVTLTPAADFRGGLESLDCSEFAPCEALRVEILSALDDEGL